MIADMRFLSRMRAGVDCQGTPLDEAFVAILDSAVVGTFIGVYPIMPAEI